jgi:hypothetical protein
MPISGNSGRITTTAGRLLLTCALALALAGCFDDSDAPRASTGTIGAPPVVTTPPGTPAANRAPTISGTPAAIATVNEPYAFQPTASDPDGDRLSFQVSNKPAWASFDATTGRLAGTPSTSSTGTFADVRVSVSDGQASSSLAPFSIAVQGIELGSATLSWQPPTANTDGSPLTNLAGYFVRYGTSATNLDRQVRIDNPGLVTYVVGELTPATWYFQVTAFNTVGVESSPSATASKTIT